MAGTQRQNNGVAARIIVRKLLYCHSPFLITGLLAGLLFGVGVTADLVGNEVSAMSVPLPHEKTTSWVDSNICAGAFGLKGQNFTANSIRLCKIAIQNRPDHYYLMAVLEHE